MQLKSVHESARAYHSTIVGTICSMHPARMWKSRGQRFCSTFRTIVSDSGIGFTSGFRGGARRAHTAMAAGADGADNPALRPKAFLRQGHATFGPAP